MKKSLFVLLAVLLSVPVFASAETKRHWFEVSYENSDYTYREPHMANTMSLKGRLQGVNAKYTYKGVLSDVLKDSDSSFLTLDFRYMGGSVDYDGYMQSGTGDAYPISHSDIGDYYLEGRFLLGQIFQATDSLAFWPYFGLGYRFLKDHLDKFAGGYQRESTYIYMPLGLDVKYEFVPSWTVGLGGEFDWLIKGRQMSRMSALEAELITGGKIRLDDTANRQTQGYGLRFSARLQKDFEHFGVFAEPFWRYWHVQNSEEEFLTAGGFQTGMVVVEPFNTTKEYGLKVGLVF